tara:strand:+ start:300 stop:602 length:303 start_codon:yes stop_codon:yes gene_type:complete
LKGGTDAKEGIYAGAEGILTPDPLLAKPRINFAVASENVLERFIKDKKNTKGLTISGVSAPTGASNTSIPRNFNTVLLPYQTDLHVIACRGSADIHTNKV